MPRFKPEPLELFGMFNKMFIHNLIRLTVKILPKLTKTNFIHGRCLLGYLSGVSVVGARTENLFLWRW